MDIVNDLQASFSLTQNDLVLISVFVVAVVASFFLVGRENILTVMLCVYISMAIVAFIPEIENGVLGIRDGNSFQVRTLFYLIMIVVLFFVLKPTTFHSPLDEEVETWQLVVVNILAGGLIACVIFSLMPNSMLEDYSLNIKFLFTNFWAKLFWILTGLGFITYLSRQE